MAVEKDEFKARRKQRQRKIRRRRLIIFLITFIIIAVITTVVLSLTVLFPVTDVKASGSKIYTSDEIIKASGLGEDDNIFTFSEKDVKKALQLRLPFIEEIKIKRRLPDSVTITVEDASEFACFIVNGEYYSVTKGKRVLNKYEEKPENLFTVRCDGVSCVLGEKIKIKSQKDEQSLDILIGETQKSGIKINEIDVTNPLSLKARVDDRFEVNFGTSGSLEKKVAHLGGMIKKIEKDRRGFINLSMWTEDKREGTFKEAPIE